jgi:hypothetical protein
MFAIDWLKRGILVERETSVLPSAAEEGDMRIAGSSILVLAAAAAFGATEVSVDARISR